LASDFWLKKQKISKWGVDRWFLAVLYFNAIDRRIFTLIQSGGGTRPCEARQPTSKFAWKGANSYRLFMIWKIRGGQAEAPLLN